MLTVEEENESSKSFIPCDQESLLPVSVVEQLLVRCSCQPSIFDPENVMF